MTPITLKEFDALNPDAKLGVSHAERIRAALAALESRDHADLVRLTAAATQGIMATVPCDMDGEESCWTFSEDGKIKFNLHRGAPEMIAEMACDIAVATLAELKRREAAQ